jgi:hypothetical protein
MDTLVAEATEWQENADQLLEQSELLPLLRRYGEVYVTGSYRYGLMMGADVDLYLLHPDASKERAASLLLELIHQGVWNAFLFGDWVQFHRSGFPTGYYLGLKRDFAGARWKVDIWHMPTVPNDLLDYNQWLEHSLTPESRALILEIKRVARQEGWKVPGTTIYDAVLQGNVASLAEFREKVALLTDSQAANRRAPG